MPSPSTADRPRLPGRGKKRRLQRHIDDVGDERVSGRRPGSTGFLRALHSRRGRVHQQAASPSSPAAASRSCARTPPRSEGLRAAFARSSPVDDPDLFEPAPAQGEQHGACGSPGPETTAGPLRESQPGSGRQGWPQSRRRRCSRRTARSHRARPCSRLRWGRSCLVPAVNGGGGRFLVRDRDVSTQVVARPHALEKAAEVVRQNVDRPVASGDAVPVGASSRGSSATSNGRSDGRRRRPSRRQPSSAPRSRRASSRGRSGTPTIVKRSPSIVAKS